MLYCGHGNRHYMETAMTNPRSRTPRRVGPDAIRISVPVPMIVFNQIEQMAQRYGMALSQYLRMVIVDHIAAKRAEEEAAAAPRRRR